MGETITAGMMREALEETGYHIQEIKNHLHLSRPVVSESILSADYHYVTMTGFFLLGKHEVTPESKTIHREWISLEKSSANYYGSVFTESNTIPNMRWILDKYSQHLLELR